jgi:hypothetical protein
MPPSPAASRSWIASGLPQHVYAMLADTAGIGNTAITGDKLTAMPTVEILDDKASYPFGLAHTGYTLSPNLGFDHEAATAGTLPGSLLSLAHRARRAGRPGLAGHLHGAWGRCMSTASR